MAYSRSSSSELRGARSLASSTLSRRDSLAMMAKWGIVGAAGGYLSSPVSAHAGEPKPPEPSAYFELKDVSLTGAAGVGKRMLLLLPKHTQKKVPLLVLLHGLGETGDERTGAYAWVERYGLARAYERLLAPPVKSLHKRLRHWKPERLEQLNRSLRRRPFEGIAVACPYTPNVYKAANRTRTLDRYAEWIRDEVIVRARREANVHQDVRHTFLDGCSLGGYVGLEVFLRLPEHFGAWGSVQGALGAHRVMGYAERLAAVSKKHGRRYIHLETSSGDPFKAHHLRLSKQLQKRGVPHDLIVPPGPHNQPFLRDSGSVEMLLWHARLG